MRRSSRPLCWRGPVWASEQSRRLESLLNSLIHGPGKNTNLPDQGYYMPDVHPLEIVGCLGILRQPSAEQFQR